MLRSHVPVAVMACALVGSGCQCEVDPRTAIMVEVDSDIALSALDRVRLQVDSVLDDGALANRLDVEYRLAERAPGDPGGSVEGRSEVRLPIRVAVLPRGALDAAIHLSAAGTPPGADAPNVFASARLTFVPERTLLLRLFLVEACIDVVCDAGQTCIEVEGEGICVDEQIDQPECSLEDLEAGRIEGCAAGCASPADCDDGSACTTDACEQGRCTHAAACGGDAPVCCDGACAECCDDAACDDGVECTNDSCAGGTCKHQSACGCEDDLDCDAGHCCDAQCFECCLDDQCEDGDPCTVDSCKEGACIFPAIECEPSADPCVRTACQAGACVPHALCDGDQVCCDGACAAQCCGREDCPPDGECVSFFCAAGDCVQEIAPDGTPCSAGVCQHATGRCVECLGNDGCPPGTRCCEGGCRECCNREDCRQDNPCVASECDPLVGCVDSCRPDGAECGPGLTCQACECR